MGKSNIQLPDLRNECRVAKSWWYPEVPFRGNRAAFRFWPDRCDRCGQTCTIGLRGRRSGWITWRNPAPVERAWQKWQVQRCRPSRARV